MLKLTIRLSLRRIPPPAKAGGPLRPGFYGTIVPLLEDPDQYVFLFIPNLGIGKNLVVVFDLSDGLLLVAC